MSDWALGKKLNSQIEGVPLNHLIWLQDYKTYGEDSYVFQNKDIWNALIRTYAFVNDNHMLNIVIDKSISDGVLYKALRSLYGVESSRVDESVIDFGAFLQTSMDSIFYPETAIKLYEKSTSAIAEIKKIISNGTVKELDITNFSKSESEVLFNSDEKNIIIASIGVVGTYGIGPVTYNISCDLYGKTYSKKFTGAIHENEVLTTNVNIPICKPCSIKVNGDNTSWAYFNVKYVEIY